MEQLFIGILLGFILITLAVLFIWNETLYDENDQKIKRNNR